MAPTTRRRRASASLAMLLGALTTRRHIRAGRRTRSPSPISRAGRARLGAVDEVYRDQFDEAAEWLDLGEDEIGTNVTRRWPALHVRQRSGRQLLGRLGWRPSPLPSCGSRRPSTSTAPRGTRRRRGLRLGPRSAALARGRRQRRRRVVAGRLIDGRLQVVDRGLLMNPIIGQARRRCEVAIECAAVRGRRRRPGADDGGRAAGRRTTSRLDIPVGPYDKAGLLHRPRDKAVGSATFDDMRRPRRRQPTLRRQAVRDPGPTERVTACAIVRRRPARSWLMCHVRAGAIDGMLQR